MDAIIDELTRATSLGWSIIGMRLFGAVGLCGLIGFERESQNRPAGLRTHMMVGLASALYTLTMLEMLAGSVPLISNNQNIATDPLRLIEAVTSGVAFLAAGMIIFANGKVHGLTTGTSLWLAAAVGLSSGLGLWLLAVATTVLALAIIAIVKKLEDGAHKRLDRSSDDG